MSWEHKVVLQCDECRVTFTVNTDSVLEAEQEAISEGWQEDHGKHYCPTH